ncbi:hypothetical protein [Aequorivita echinoideorum]|uniref:Uncharacterized protein n=1 Tax=Aequorivita echinoideorum TaxID=1549647 RepID=A0ABS5S8Q4_9FLAO|nr:hypothetical protein [Aequorivita echinoideorum]MBT0608805.1 hypothetical protein [Aequorivita echinoideorum]
MKKQLIAITFLFILIAPAVTIYGYLQFEKKSLKREIKRRIIAGIAEEELVLLKFSKEESKTQLRWEHSKEFEFEGQMYDVVSKKTVGDSIFYRCWWDHDETALNKKLKNLVADAWNLDKKNTDAQINLYSFLNSFFFNETVAWQPKVYASEIIFHKVLLHPQTFRSIIHSPPTPPPRRF